jgi:diacylglycerol O-acyltransferase/trehalose O-mycolyltransferase
VRKGRIVAAATATVLAVLATAMVAVAAPAPAEPHPAASHRTPHGGYAELLVPSTMGPVKVQVQWAARGGSAALYLLDGMRARNDANGWALETNAMQQFAHDDVTLVMPVGGQASFYTDWYAPSASNGQQFTYKWETFLTKELPDYLTKYGVSPHNDAIVGLSMGGSAALALAAYHHEQFKFAGSMSGFLDLTSPGMPTAVRLAMMEAGAYDADAMWGPPMSAAWRRNDPSVFAPKLRGISLFIAAGDGIPGPADRMSSLGDVTNSFAGIGLELLALLNSREFQARMAALRIPVTWDFTPTGTHEWGYWQTELGRARPHVLAALDLR